jgi:citrate synthase
MSWISTEEALALMQVRAQTLYANVSRGKIRAKADAKDPRRSRYWREDVVKLAQRRPGQRKTEAVASGTIAWGEPVLPSALSTIIDGRLYYRGQDAVQLAEHATLEEVAALLWQCEAPLAAVPSTPVLTSKVTGGAATDTIPRALLALATRLGDDLPSLRRAAPVLREEAAQVFATVVDALIGPAPAAGRPQRTLSARLARAWRRPQAEDLIRRALVLLADHELNTSTFATRVSISTGAPLAGGVLAGLITLCGPLHGGAAAQVAQLVDAAAKEGVETVVRHRLAQGRRLGAFGHPMYPHGDCRASALLAQMVVPPLHAELAACVEQLVGELPNVDFALSAMASALALPRHAPLTLFAIARCVGWLAHALEQVSTGKLIRPRARYVGPMPAITL